MDSNPLAAYARNVTSQDGEDGIIARIFEILGEHNRWCLEVGALNGTHHSNSWNLLNNRGWHGLLIEADVTYFRKLSALYEKNKNVRCVNAFVSFEGPQSLDVLCRAADMPEDFDLLVIDIDGNDYHLWDSMRRFEPRVVCIEFNQTIPNSIEFVQPRNMHVNQGSSLRSIEQLAGRKGYRLVGTTGCNAFFVKGEDFPKFKIQDASLDALHPDTRFQTQLFQLYDGTLCISGYNRLLWHNQPIDVGKLQVLPPRLRRYPAHIDKSEGIRRLKDWIRRQPFYGIIRKLRS